MKDYISIILIFALVALFFWYKAENKALKEEIDNMYNYSTYIKDEIDRLSKDVKEHKAKIHYGN